MIFSCLCHLEDASGVWNGVRHMLCRVTVPSSHLGSPFKKYKAASYINTLSYVVYMLCSDITELVIKMCETRMQQVAQLAPTFTCSSFHKHQTEHKSACAHLGQAFMEECCMLPYKLLCESYDLPIEEARLVEHRRGLFLWWPPDSGNPSPRRSTWFRVIVSKDFKNMVRMIGGVGPTNYSLDLCPSTLIKAAREGHKDWLCHIINSSL